MSNTKKEKSTTNNQGWTIKGIDAETRVAIQKVAKKEGKTLGQYCNTKLREAANNTLKISSSISIQPEDIQNEVKTQINALKEKLADIIKLALNQDKLKTKQKSFFQKIFS